MLTQITVNGENAFTVPIFGAKPKDSLLVQSIAGLNPPPLNLFIGDYSRDGGNYQGRRVGVRNVVITMKLNPNPALGETVSTLRQALYKAFTNPQSGSEYVKIDLHMSDGRVLYLVGYAENIETEIFSAQTLVQISILCPDPYLRDEDPKILNNDSGWTILPFKYDGTAGVGFEAEIDILADTSVLTLAINPVTDDLNSELYPRGRMVINHDLIVGDTVVINTARTTQGTRGVELKARPGREQRSLLNALTPTSTWLELTSTNNIMKVYGTEPSDLVAGVTQLTYTQSYWGV